MDQVDGPELVKSIVTSGRSIWSYLQSIQIFLAILVIAKNKVKENIKAIDGSHLHLDAFLSSCHDFKIKLNIFCILKKREFSVPLIKIK